MLCEDCHHSNHKTNSAHYTSCYSLQVIDLFFTKLSLLELSSLSLFVFATRLISVLLIFFWHDVCQQALLLLRVNSIPLPLSKSKAKGFSSRSCWEAVRQVNCCLLQHLSVLNLLHRQAAYLLLFCKACTTSS